MNMFNIDEVKQQVVIVLQAEELEPEEQDTLILSLTNALLERATLTLMSKLPPEAIAELDENQGINKDTESMLKYFEKYIPNMDEVIQSAFKEGLDIYKEGLEQPE